MHRKMKSIQLQYQNDVSNTKYLFPIISLTFLILPTNDAVAHVFPESAHVLPLHKTT